MKENKYTEKLKMNINEIRFFLWIRYLRCVYEYRK